MAWLGIWAKRRKITVDNTNIDSDLTHFPVPIVLGTSVGQSSQDVSDIFDEVGASFLKTAITKIDGTTQIYGDVETWDNSTEKAVVHVAKSDLDITSANVTELYIYFDSAQSDNTTYISASGGTAAQSVWDSNFKAVYHMAQDPSGSAPQILDSTSNNNDGTSGGTMTSGDLVDGVIGKAIDFDGAGDYIDLSSHVASFEGLSNGTIFTTFKLSSTAPANSDIFFLGDGLTSPQNFMFLRTGSGNITSIYTDESFRFAVYRAGSIPLDFVIRNGEGYYADDTDHTAAVRIDGIDNAMFIDGVKQTVTFKEGTTTTNEFSNIDNPAFVAIGNRKYDGSVGGTDFKGPIGELLFSDTGLSDAWVKATHYALTDDLLTYGATEIGSGTTTTTTTTTSSSTTTVTGSTTTSSTFSTSSTTSSSSSSTTTNTQSTTTSTTQTIDIIRIHQTYIVI